MKLFSCASTTLVHTLSVQLVLGVFFAAAASAAAAADSTSFAFHPLRHLQTNDTSGSAADIQAQTCLPDGSVSFRDDFRTVAFNRPSYNATCTCAASGNQATLFDTSANPALANVNDTVAFVAAVNAAVAELMGGEQYACQDGCELCYDSGSGAATAICGLLETSEQSSYTGRKNANVTYDDLMTASVVVEDLVDASQSYQLCFNYTQGLTGRVCFGGSVSTASDNGSSSSTRIDSQCFVSYNGVNCTSCTTFNVTLSDASCRTADCTNLPNGVGTMLSTCNGGATTTSTAGVFEIVRLYDSLATTGFLPGSCTTAGGASAPAAPTTSGGGATPAPTSSTGESFAPVAPTTSTGESIAPVAPTTSGGAAPAPTATTTTTTIGGTAQASPTATATGGGGTTAPAPNAATAPTTGGGTAPAPPTSGGAPQPSAPTTKVAGAPSSPTTASGSSGQRRNVAAAAAAMLTLLAALW